MPCGVVPVFLENILIYLLRHESINPSQRRRSEFGCYHLLLVFYPRPHTLPYPPAKKLEPGCSQQKNKKHSVSILSDAVFYLMSPCMMIYKKHMITTPNWTGHQQKGCGVHTIHRTGERTVYTSQTNQTYATTHIVHEKEENKCCTR